MLWSGIDGKPVATHASIVYHGGKLYHGDGMILDAATGKILAGKVRDRQNRATPNTRHLLWVAGDRVVGVREDKGTGKVEVYDLTGKKVSELALSVPVADGDRRDRIIETVGGPRWGFSYGCPFMVVENRLYVRAHGELWCLGEKK